MIIRELITSQRPEEDEYTLATAVIGMKLSGYEAWRWRLYSLIFIAA